MADIEAIVAKIREDIERMDREYEAAKKAKEKRESAFVPEGIESGKLDGANRR